MKSGTVSVVLAWLTMLMTGLADEPPRPAFVDVTAQAGLQFNHSFGDAKLSSILEATGPGCAFFDYDNDGHLDIYLVNGAHLSGISDPYPEGEKPTRQPINRLFRNNGKGVFSDTTERAGVGDRGYGMGVVVGDYDNDGDPDLFVANYGPNVLYRNNGDGTFTDVTRTAGVGGPETLNGFPKWSLHGCFLDYNGDGLLDLYVANYLAFDPGYAFFFGPEGFPGPLSYKGQGDLLYRNNGDGTFADVSTAAGVHNPKGRAMSVGAGDIDDDGDIDLFVANDAMENYLYLNSGKGTFSDSALLKGVAFGAFGEATSSMAPILEDFDDDDDLDLFVPDMGYSCLYRNDGLIFEEVTAASGIAEACGQYTSWAPVSLDFDNDGDRDLFVTNGDAHHLYPEEDLLFDNQGAMRFADASLHSGDYFTKAEYVGRGAAAGDYDNDGDVDIVVVNVVGPAILLRNEVGSRHHWLAINPVGTTSNRDGIGARIRITAGGRSQLREVRTAAGFLSSSDRRVHFGLGQQTKAELVEVRWPSGMVQTLKNVAADQILTLTEPARESAK